MFKPLAQQVRNWVADTFSQAVASEEFLLARRNGALSIERRFFRGLRLHNGVYKVTSSGRLGSTHALAVSALTGLGRQVARVLDVGCSSGISTVELHQALQLQGLKVETVGTDLVLRATRVEDSLGKCLFTERAQLMQVESRGWAMQWPPRRQDWALYPVRALWVQALLASRGKAYRACLSAPRVGFRVTTIPLTSSAVESVPGLSIAEEDILQPLALGAFDLVRAANVLNRVYFTPDVLRDMAASLWNRLLPDGMLLVVRSRSGFNNGTLFARSEGKSEIVARLGEGSEIEDIVLEASRQAHRTGPATA